MIIIVILWITVMAMFHPAVFLVCFAIAMLAKSVAFVILSSVISAMIFVVFMEIEFFDMFSLASLLAFLILSSVIYSVKQVLRS